VISPSEPPGSPLIPSAPVKPIRFWFAVGDQDLFYPNPTIPDGMHDWTLAAALMAKVLAAKGHRYQYVFARKFQARRPADRRADFAAGARMALEGLSGSLIPRCSRGVALWRFDEPANLAIVWPECHSSSSSPPKPSKTSGG
jgi:hypothetical protein